MMRSVQRKAILLPFLAGYCGSTGVARASDPTPASINVPESAAKPGGGAAKHARGIANRPESRVVAYSPYEQEAIDEALQEHHTSIEPSPNGKVIHRVLSVRLEVFEKRDVFPSFFNVFHATSREYVVRRELLQKEGDVFDYVLIDETARNLRRLPAFSLVVAVPVKSAKEGCVDVLVITKDIWSLRLNSNIAISSGGLESLQLEPNESNFLGSHQRLGFKFLLRPETLSLGLAYGNPRYFGTRLAVSANASVIIDRRTGEGEGSFGGAEVVRPLFAAQTAWAWGASAQWANQRIRRYVNAKWATYDDPNTPEKEEIPDVYRRKNLVNVFAVTRSFGWDNKIDVTFGAEMNLRSAFLENVEGYSPASLAAFTKERLPIGEKRVGPFFQLRSYTTNFLRVTDLETLSLQEDYRLGRDLWFRAYTVLAHLGSTRTFLGLSASAQTTHQVGKDGLFRAGIEATAETNFETVSDASLELALRLATPKFLLGRFVFYGYAYSKFRNYMNRQTSVGGEGRLRGYPTAYFVGRDFASVNVEFRSRPVEIFSLQLAATAFFDMADAPRDLGSFKFHGSTGFGLRTLFPQLDRAAIRFDLAFPVERPLPVGVRPVAFFIGFEQAFPMPAVGTSAYTGGISTLGNLGQ